MNPKKLFPFRSVWIGLKTGSIQFFMFDFIHVMFFSLFFDLFDIFWHHVWTAPYEFIQPISEWWENGVKNVTCKLGLRNELDDKENREREKMKKWNNQWGIQLQKEKCIRTKDWHICGNGFVLTVWWVNISNYASPSLQRKIKHLWSVFN